MTRRFARAIVVALVVLAIVATAVAQQGGAPSRQLRIVNNTEFILDIDVASADRDGWVPLAVLGRDAATDIHDIADLGDTWVFRFTSAGVDGGELEVTRAELAASGWEVAVPSVVADRLRRAAVPAAPTR